MLLSYQLILLFFQKSQTVLKHTGLRVSKKKQDSGTFSHWSWQM